VAWIAIQGVVGTLVTLPYPWLETAFGFLTGLGALIGLGFLIAPVSAVFAGLFIDDIAEQVEQTHYTQDPLGRSPPLSHSLWLTAKFTAFIILVNLVALFLVLIPGINFTVFIVANGYLLGREYFEFAALRFHAIDEVRRLRRRHSGTIFLCGLIIAGLLTIPLLNLLTPLLATAFMVHMHKRLGQSPKTTPFDGGPQ
jgi:CysZ protein